MNKILEMQVLANIDMAFKELDRVHSHLITGNKNGNQMDYTTNPRISNEVDKLLKKVQVIEKIVYQKYRG